MSNYSKTIGTIEIECPRCGCKTSYQKILGNNTAEFGECTSCGKMTYHKQLNELNTQNVFSNPQNIQCPYCKSTNVKKISATSKVTHTALFGLASMKKVNSNWHCNNCKSDF